MKKVIFFDLDGTLTPESTWYKLNLLLGITLEEDKELFEKYLKDDLKYNDWTAEITRIHKSRGSITKDEIIKFAESVEVRNGAPEIIKFLKEKGCTIILLSGSVDIVVETVAKKLEIPDWLACSSLIFDSENILDEVRSTGDEIDSKIGLAKSYIEINEIKLEDCYSVEDGGNGIEMFKNMKGILLGNNKDLVPFAWKQIKTLSEIKDII